MLGQVAGTIALEDFHLVRTAFEGRLQPPSQEVELAQVGAAGRVMRARELHQEPVAAAELGHPFAALQGNLVHPPGRATIEHGQLRVSPSPLVGQAAQQAALPAFGAPLFAELAVHFQVQAAPHQFQPSLLTALHQVALDPSVDHDIRVETVKVELIGEDRLLVVQAQAPHGGVFAGIGFGQQQLEQGLVRGIDALEQLPKPGADEFVAWDLRQVTQVQGFPRAYETLCQQGLGVGRVAALLVGRHQPPQRRPPCQPKGRAVELVQQKIMLRSAAIVGAELACALALSEGLGVNQKDVRIGALARGPGLQQLAFAL